MIVVLFLVSVDVEAYLCLIKRCGGAVNTYNMLRLVGKCGNRCFFFNNKRVSCSDWVSCKYVKSKEQRTFLASRNVFAVLIIDINVGTRSVLISELVSRYQAGFFFK